MANYRVVITGVDAKNIRSLEKKIGACLGDEFKAQVTKQDPARSRADQLAEAESNVDGAKSIVEGLLDELQSWLDGLPENLQSGSKVNDAISELKSIQSGLEDIDMSTVSFPGMY